MHLEQEDVLEGGLVGCITREGRKDGLEAGLWNRVGWVDTCTLNKRMS